jgi:uncharacterized protein (TIGR03083 family)
MTSDRPRTQAAHDAAVEALVARAAATSDWEARTPCGGWTAADVAGHVVCIARYYHRLLDAATEGRPLVDLPRGDALSAMNARELAALDGTGRDHAEAYAERARAYGARLATVDWDLVLGVWDGVGPLTVAQHTGLAVGEWELHAWDLARAAGDDHRPADPAVAAAARAVLPAPPVDGEPWTGLLRWAGRDPAWTA